MINSALDDVIKEGLRLKMKANLNFEMVQIWTNYSMEIINLISRNNFIKYQYSTIVANALLGNDSPNNKIDACLRFLINNYSMI